MGARLRSENGFFAIHCVLLLQMFSVALGGSFCIVLEKRMRSFSN